MTRERSTSALPKQFESFVSGSRSAQPWRSRQPYAFLVREFQPSDVELQCLDAIVSAKVLGVNDDDPAQQAWQVRIAQALITLNKTIATSQFISVASLEENGVGQAGRVIQGAQQGAEHCCRQGHGGDPSDRCRRGS